MFNIPLFPEQASSFAWKVDLQYWALIILSAAFAIPIAALIVFFAARYRVGANVDRSNPPETSHRMEIAWIVFPLALALGMFTWASSLYIEMVTPPARAQTYYATGKQWMWKFQHPTGQREINELHVPLGQPIRMVMTSQDVIHSFYVPAFRVKQDVLPGRYTEVWFEATRTGEFHLYCTEYCGAQHATMGGRVVVMEPAQYQEWLSGGGGEGTGQTDEPLSPAAAGEGLFTQIGCNGCHRPDDGGAGPSLVGIFNQQEDLEGGDSVLVDEAYLRESILQPQAKIVAGYTDQVMPSYEGQIDDTQLTQLIEYIKTLGQDPQQGN